MTYSDLRIDPAILQVIRFALAEDIGREDVTTTACIPEKSYSRAQYLAKQQAVIAGLPIVEAVLREVDSNIVFSARIADGDEVSPGEAFAFVHGQSRSLLTAERVSLNFLTRLSGIATQTRACVRAIAGTPAQIIDTRKTTPGLRILEKYAVRAGGGKNHRFGLDDGILIKDNHIMACGGVVPAIRNARARAHHLLAIEVECDTLDQVREALPEHPAAILLDNMSIEQLREGVALIRSSDERIRIEASGSMGVNPERLRAVAETGVDFISIGALTHSAPHCDISLDFLPTEV